MKLYTKRGDDGSTDLFGGRRVPKDSPRVEAYGGVDELNSALGLALAASKHAEITTILVRLQNRLFDFGSDLATPRREPGTPTSDSAIRRIGPNDIADAEADIDALCAPLPPLRTFILPGGSDLAARLHLARSICRRAERAAVALSREEDLGPSAVIYLNRLSDLLFSAARRANQLEGREDTPWEK